VKASGDRTRTHNLSAEQCQPPPGTIGILASLFIEGIGGGLSLLELIHAVENRLIGEDKLILQLQATIAETLGETLPAALSTCFDERLAESSLQFYDLLAIPAIRGWVPSGVTEVRFRSDLSQTSTVTLSELIAQSSRLLDLLPTHA
jgi:tRNA A22 N-methylase